MEQVLRITYLFAADVTMHSQVTRECTFKMVNSSPKTIADLHSSCGELVMSWLNWFYERKPQIGGPIVQIDEMKLGRWMYQRGRLVDGSWIFGAIDSETTELQLDQLGRSNFHRKPPYFSSHWCSQPETSGVCLISCFSLIIRILWRWKTCLMNLTSQEKKIQLESRTQSNYALQNNWPPPVSLMSLLICSLIWSINHLSFYGYYLCIYSAVRFTIV